MFSSSILIVVLTMRTALMVLFLRLNSSLTIPSHSAKSTGGGGFLGSIRTTRLSTLGGGRKLFLPTFISWSTFARSCVFTERRQYSASPGLAVSRSANSSWNIITAHRNDGLCASSLNTRGDEIWYGTFATHRSKNGHAVLIASPCITVSLRSFGVPSTRFRTSRTMRLSYSIAITFFDWSHRGTVMLPVPGPISSTTSVGFTPALATMAVTTAGFFRKCCPRFVLGAMRLRPADEPSPPPAAEACFDAISLADAYGDGSDPDGRDRFARAALGILERRLPVPRVSLPPLSLSLTRPPATRLAPENGRAARRRDGGDSERLIGRGWGR
mmetsp:Transcript_19615/g.39760  ORF Transcript_19615/g.39760 Transcript_19615/m.39760 type:complete len:328 (-) Transcript_19615:95-1078(-)